MRRGDVVIVAPPGDFSKPRPAMVLQEELVPESEVVTVALMTSDLSHHSYLRIRVEPSEGNGLRKTSEIMIDNVQTFRVRKVGDVVGVMDDETIERVKDGLALFFGL